MSIVGTATPRLEAPGKVTGDAKYVNDMTEPGLLHACLVTSTQAHAWLKGIDAMEALEVPGVLAVVTGQNYPHLYGPVLADRPAIAFEKARYYGEPVALVVAHDEAQARRAAYLVRVEYEPLPVVNSVQDALKLGATLVHENMGRYEHVIEEIYPEPGSNIAHRLKVRKGDMQRGWSESEVVVETEVSLPQSDHAAMETRAAKARIDADGKVYIHSTSQAPEKIKTDLSRYFHVDLGKIVVHTPLVGGAYGGKTPVQLEVLAYLASRAVGGRQVSIANTREEDIATSPVQIGFAGRVKLGAKRDGRITVAEMTYMIECGAYTDTGPIMTKAVSANGTGPYNIANVQSDTLCVYTNHTWVTAFRGFGHAAYTFAMERAMEKLAFALGMDPWELRRINAILPGHTTPSRAKLTPSNLGNVPACLEKVKNLIRWEEGRRIETPDGKIRAKGLSCLWKTSSSPADAVSGAVLIMNADGTLNLNVGVVECGQGTKTGLAQIAAERLGMRMDQIHVAMDVNTLTSPVHWKTVASMSTYMAGRAVLEAVEKVIDQLRSMAAIIMRCPSADLEVYGGRVFLKDDPETYLPFQQIAHGFKYPNGNSIGGQIMGHGSFIMRHLNPPDKETGAGKSGPSWTVGAEAVEVEYDPAECTYLILKAATVLDVGRVINPMMARGQITGAVKMGLDYGSREALIRDDAGILQNTSFRTYRMMRYGENPTYLVDFVETPDITAPYGERGLGEEGILGMPAALANALSTAAQVELNHLPLTPETIWRAKNP